MSIFTLHVIYICVLYNVLVVKLVILKYHGNNPHQSITLKLKRMAWWGDDAVPYSGRPRFDPQVCHAYF